MGTWAGAETRWAPPAQAVIVQPQLPPEPMGQEREELQGSQQYMG